MVSVTGRSRVPSPAASTIAVRGGTIIRRNMPSRARQVAVEPASDRVEGRVGELLFEQPPDPREVDEVAWLAVAPPQPREDAEDLAIALSREDGRRSQERRPVERRKSSKIALGHLPAEVGRERRAGRLRGAIRDRSSAGRIPRPENRGARSPAPRSDPATASNCRRDSRAAPRYRREAPLAAEAFATDRDTRRAGRRITALQEPPGHTNRPGAPPRRGAAPRRKGASRGSRAASTARCSSTSVSTARV